MRENAEIGRANQAVFVCTSFITSADCERPAPEPASVCMSRFRGKLPDGVKNLKGNVHMYVPLV